MSRTRDALAASLLAGAVGAALVACLGDQATARTTPVTPDRASFGVVAQAVVHRCGSLDCHGSTYRNLRVYGNEGMRLAAGDLPLTPALTTAAEISEDFVSIVGLEPELMAEVVSSGGAQPERLSLVRKARGSEVHKGGSVVTPGDDWDNCVTSWLASATDTAACVRAAPPL